MPWLIFVMARSLSSIQSLAYFLLAIVLLVFCLSTAAFILVPLVWSIFIAFSIYPISNWLEGKRIPRGWAIFLSLIVVSALVFGVIYILTIQMVDLIRDIPQIGHSFRERLEIYLTQIQSWLGDSLVIKEINWSFYQFFSPERLQATLTSTVKSLTLAGIIPLFTFLLLYYKDFFVEFIRRVSIKSNAHILKWAEDSGDVILNYITGML